MGGSSAQKAQLDAHMREARTQARLRSKEIWYGWRGQLLEGLEEGLRGIKKGLEEDGDSIADKEGLLENLLPSMLQQQESMQDEAQRLEEAAAAINEDEKEELHATRERLTSINEQIEERRRMVAEFERDLSEQQRFIDIYAETKAECFGAIQESERIKDSSRGWSIDEVTDLRNSVTQLERQTGWTIASASSSSLTMVYRNQVQLFFDTAAFQPLDGKPNSPRKASPKKRRENQPISLTYIADAHEHRSEPLTTEKRFFLQLMRAQLQCIVQHQTSVKHLLSFVSHGWDTATSVHETLRRLALEHVVDISILSDERLGVEVSILLPKVETKVRLAFELGASIAAVPVDGEEEEQQAFKIKNTINVVGKVVYGEQYKEAKMGDFILSRIGNGGIVGWEEAVGDLKARLVATGRKATS